MYTDIYFVPSFKWFTSAPMCDIFLTLAKTKGHDTPSCFIVPRWLDDGTRNSGFQVMRLKNKLGDRSNASSEVEYNAAYGKMIGAEGKGVKTIISMVQSTRLDCVIGSAGYGRRAMQHAILHAVELTIRRIKSVGIYECIYSIFLCCRRIDQHLEKFLSNNL